MIPRGIVNGDLENSVIVLLLTPEWKDESVLGHSCLGWKQKHIIGCSKKQCREGNL